MAVEVWEVTVLVLLRAAVGMQCAGSDCERFALSAAKPLYGNVIFY